MSDDVESGSLTLTTGLSKPRPEITDERVIWTAPTGGACDRFVLSESRGEILRFESSGKVFIRGEEVDDNPEIYKAFRAFLQDAWRPETRALLDALALGDFPEAVWKAWVAARCPGATSMADTTQLVTGWLPMADPAMAAWMMATATGDDIEEGVFDDFGDDDFDDDFGSVDGFAVEPPSEPPDRVAVWLEPSPGRVPTHCMNNDTIIAQDPPGESGDPRYFDALFDLIPLVDPLPTEPGLWIWAAATAWRRPTDAEAAACIAGRTPFESRADG